MRYQDMGTLYAGQDIDDRAATRGPAIKGPMWRGECVVYGAEVWPCPFCGACPCNSVGSCLKCDPDKVSTPCDPSPGFSKYLEYRDNTPALNNAKHTGYLSFAPTLDTIYAVHHGS